MGSNGLDHRGCRTPARRPLRKEERSEDARRSEAQRKGGRGERRGGGGGEGYRHHSTPLNDSVHSLSLTMRQLKPRKSLELARVHTAGDGQSSEQPALASSPEGGPRSLPQGLREAEVSLPPHLFTPLQSAAECRSQLRIRVSAPYPHQHSPPPTMLCIPMPGAAPALLLQEAS